MKYFKRLGLWKASNLEYSPSTGKGYSYDWYRIVDVIDGKVVLNTYGYSATTIRHVCKLRKLLDTLGIRVDVQLEAPEGLQNLNASAQYLMLQLSEVSERKHREGSKREQYRLERLANIQQQLDFLSTIYTKRKVG